MAAAKGVKAVKGAKGGCRGQGKGKGKGAKGYQLPEPLPLGLVLRDSSKREWSLGPSIGRGGFGEIYSARPASLQSDDYSFVIKVEPHENGPLFVEKNFYIKVAKTEEVGAWEAARGVSLGIPRYHGSGSHLHRHLKYRFLVVDRLGGDLWTEFEAEGRRFDWTKAADIASQLVWALEYLHGRGYVHADIKGGNVLRGRPPATHRVFLVDFGLVTRFAAGPAFAPDPKKMHNGTLLYTSRDMHQGVATRRGDLEILCYNLVEWCCGRLPWEGVTQPPAVHEAKQQFWEQQFGSGLAIPPGLKKLLEYTGSLAFDQGPDYDLCRRLLAPPPPAAARTARSSKARTPRSSTARTPRSSTARTPSSPRPGAELQAPDTPPAPKRRKPPRQRAAVASPAKTNGTASAAGVKRSWRDAPTMQASASTRSASGAGSKKSWRSAPTLQQRP